MAIPEEDLGPRWLREYGYIAVDIDGLNDVGEKLRFEHDNFLPHMDRVAGDMKKMLPPVYANFQELMGALQQQHLAQTETLKVLQEQAIAIDVLAQAAATLSKRYGDADAFGAARSQDVDQLLVDPASLNLDGGTPATNDLPATGAQTVPLPGTLPGEQPWANPDGGQVPAGDNMGGM